MQRQRKISYRPLVQGPKDWVIFARYAGSRMEIEGGEIRMLNDDEILRNDRRSKRSYSRNVIHRRNYTMQEEEMKIDVGDADEQATEIDLEETARRNKPVEEAPAVEVSEEVKEEKVDQSDKAEEEKPAETELLFRKAKLDEYERRRAKNRIAKSNTQECEKLKEHREEAIAYAQQLKKRKLIELRSTVYHELDSNYTNEFEQKSYNRILRQQKQNLLQAIAAGNIEESRSDAQTELSLRLTMQWMLDYRISSCRLKEVQGARTAAPENIAQTVPTEMPVQPSGHPQQPAQVDPRAEQPGQLKTLGLVQIMQ